MKYYLLEPSNFLTGINSDFPEYNHLEEKDVVIYKKYETAMIDYLTYIYFYFSTDQSERLSSLLEVYEYTDINPPNYLEKVDIDFLKNSSKKVVYIIYK